MPLWPVSSSSSPAQPEPTRGFLSETPKAVRPGPGLAPQRRLRLLVAYLGAPFHGFALQGDLPTVAGVLGHALERVLRHPVELTCAGRTDAGVHAWGQVVSLDVRADADLARVQRSVNKMLAPDVVVREAAWAPPLFDARRGALSRLYRYHLLCSEWADPLTAATTWHVGRALEVRRMEAACDALLGEHDFSSFCHPVRASARGVRPGPLVRRVLRAGWSEAAGSRLCFEIEASSFCHQMVRSIVGTMVEVGTGRLKAGQLTSVLAARNRAAAGPPAPPHGLCLWEVKYPPQVPDGEVTPGS
jgi:tRNA pseudouridine38-40 synthase